MKNMGLKNLVVLIVISGLIIIAGLIENLPWPSFVIPVIILGAVTKYLKWEMYSFQIAFLSGFLVWFIFNSFTSLFNNDIVMDKISGLIQLPKTIVLMFSGIIGGLLTGLSFYTGRAIFVTSNSTGENIEKEF